MGAAGYSSNIYVALVDDDDSICRSLDRLLRAVGMKSITYPSAEAFLSDNKHPKFDCLVLDVRLGGMSGLELQETISNTIASPHRGTPVIFITAHDDFDAKEQAMRNGCVGYFSKTAPGTEIVAAIRSASKC